MEQTSKRCFNLNSVDNNVYYKNDAKMFMRTLGAIQASRLGNLVHWISRNKDIVQWISSQLPILQQNNVSKTTKIYWILHGLQTFPICPTCNTDERFKNKSVVSLLDGYSKHCSYRCLSIDPEVQARCKATHLKNLGCEWPMQSKKVQARSIKSCRKKYGVDNVSQIEDVKQAKLNTTIANFGTSNKYNRTQAAQTMRNKSFEEKEEIQARFTSTTFQHLGVSYPMQSNEVQKKSRSLYCYDDKNFRSSWELAKYIYHRDRGDDFEYQPCTVLEYEDKKGIKHSYHPDFIVNGQLQEVKGDHFFGEDGKMKLPYRKKAWSDQRYQEECDKYEAKHECMIANKVQILTYDDIKPCLDYIVEKYGSKKYLEKFKLKK